MGDIRVVRGYQRRIVFLKNTGSKIFEQAYFVLSERAESMPPLYEDMIAEANRIIDENMSASDKELSLLRRICSKIKRNIIPFFVGGAVCSLITAILFIVF